MTPADKAKLLKQERAELIRWMQKFSISIMSRLAERFPADDMPVLSAFEIFNPQKAPDNGLDLAMYGNHEINLLCKQYAHNKTVNGVEHPALVDEDDVIVGWQLFKSELPAWKKGGYNIASMYAMFMAILPDGIKELIQIRLVLVFSTACCERGFSLMKIIKSALRNRLYIETLDALMTISMLGARYAEGTANCLECGEDCNGDCSFDAALDHWEGDCLRNPNKARWGNNSAAKSRLTDVRNVVPESGFGAVSEPTEQLVRWMSRLTSLQMQSKSKLVWSLLLALLQEATVIVMTGIMLGLHLSNQQQTF
jgi:hypothetical protein